MRKLEINVNHTTEAQDFITYCENKFSSEIDLAIEDVLSHNVKIITLSGPTCSGKTTTATHLVRRINESGHRAVVLSIDDFYKDRDENERNNTENKAPDYDSVKSIDLEYLKEFTSALLAGETVRIPRYSFTEGIRVGYDEYIPDHRDIYVFEGIQAVYPEVTALFGDNYKSIFISVADDVTYRGVELSQNEIRLLRRIVRDNQFRNATAEFTFFLWDGVRDNEEKNIFPNATECDVYINSFLEYELFIIDNHVKGLLLSVPNDSIHRADAEELYNKISVFDNPYFEDRMIPENSVFREFIG